MKKILYCLMLIFTFLSCSEEFLDEKSDQKLLVPNTLEDFQLLLDNYGVMNRTPGLGMVASDDFSITDVGYNTGRLLEDERAAYIWDMESVAALRNDDWITAYEQVFYSNVVLDGLNGLVVKEGKYNEVKGSALFYRSYAFFWLLQMFATPYRSETASETAAIPLPLSSDISAERPVVTIQTAYDQIISDLTEAGGLLPNDQAIKTRPSKVAALSLLGRVYLIRGEYDRSEAVLREAIAIKPDLLDYNTLSSDADRPFPTDYPTGSGNKEIVFYSPFIGYRYLSPNNVDIVINPDLYHSYHDNDLRKSLYFRDQGSGTINFKGSYSGPLRMGELFSGISNDENYLNYAEALVRNNKIDRGLEVLNGFLRTRFMDGEYEDFYSTNREEVLDFVLSERGKSLVGKGTRWFDIRRFIHDPTRFIDAKRVLNGTSYELTVGDDRVTFPFPANENE